MQAAYDGVIRVGRTLHDKCALSNTPWSVTPRRDVPGFQQDVRKGIDDTCESVSNASAEGSTTIDAMLTELKTKWTGVCRKSVDRQKALEDSMLLAGQFKEALQMLLDWLYKMEPGLGDSLPVHGDRDTVASLIEAHKVDF